MIARIGAIPVPGPTQITGVSSLCSPASVVVVDVGNGGDGGRRRAPLRIPTRICVVTPSSTPLSFSMSSPPLTPFVCARLGVGLRALSHVVQSPRRGALSFVRYCTIATHSSIRVAEAPASAFGDPSSAPRPLSCATRDELAMENCRALIGGKTSKI